MITAKRVYEPAASSDGERFLVERLWPRGIPKQASPMTAWIKEAAPSVGLRQWFGHDPAKWEEFRRRYFDELDGKPEVLNHRQPRPADRGRATGGLETGVLSATERVSHSGLTQRQRAPGKPEGLIRLFSPA